MSNERQPSATEPRTVLVFKHEAEVNGEPIGPVEIFTDTRADPTKAEVVEVPFVPTCVCERRQGFPGEHCARCGREIPEPWVTLAEARARARELGLDLKET
jgi:hypothetical protein